MSHRLRTKGSRKFNQAACQAGKDRARMSREFDPRPPEREGRLFYRFTAECFEFGEPVKHVYALYGTKRCDSFRVVVDDVTELPGRMGRSRVHAMMRKAFPRVLSPRNL